MGLRSRTAILSLWIELLVVLIFAATVAAVMAIGAALPVVRRTDPLPTLAPAPSAVVPTVVVWATFLALAVASLVATVYAERAARRADVGEELRLA
jgi:hypothetical protein